MNRIKHILNKDTSVVVDEMLAGFLAAYRNLYTRVEDLNAVRLRRNRQDKVALVIGGGTGHEPLFSGFVGPGLADAAADGNICASPNPELIYRTAKAVDQGKGVIFVYGNYAGDNLNFDMAEEICNKDGIKTTHVRNWDDIASAPVERITDRRGIAGDVFIIKVAGAACDAGLSLEEVTRITEKARDNTFTIGVATSPGTLPGNEHPTFQLKDNEIEYGMGLHGEPGIERVTLEGRKEEEESTIVVDAQMITERMYSELKKEMGLKKGDKVAVLVNSLGSTPLIELNLVYYDLHKLMRKDGLVVHDAEIKTWCTCMEMGGVSVTIMRLDDELIPYMDAPCYSPFYAKGQLTGAMAAEEIPEDEPEEEFDESDTDEWPVKRSKEGVLDRLSAEDVRNMLIYTAGKVIANKPYLTEIDSVIGDGDHGIGMAGGMQKARKKLAKMQGEDNAYKLFEEAGEAMLMSMGGASGVIFGSLYLAGAKDMDKKETLGVKELADMEDRALAAIMERGGAKVGDKTMVDALAPAVEALHEHEQDSLLEALKAAEAAAAQGVENTKNCLAKFGRARTQAKERQLGHQDAGATSVYLIFRSMREYVEGEV